MIDFPLTESQASELDDDDKSMPEKVRKQVVLVSPLERRREISIRAKGCKGEGRP